MTDSMAEMDRAYSRDMGEERLLRDVARALKGILTDARLTPKEKHDVTVAREALLRRADQIVAVWD